MPIVRLMMTGYLKKVQSHMILSGFVINCFAITDLKCTDPKVRKEKLRPKKIKEIAEPKSEVLADEPHHKKVEESIVTDHQREPKLTVTSKPMSDKSSSAVINFDIYFYLMVVLISQRLLS